MYLNGTIKETTFDQYNILVDADSKGTVVIKTNDISRENRHWAKILMSAVQIREQHLLVSTKQIKNYGMKKQLYESE